MVTMAGDGDGLPWCRDKQEADELEAEERVTVLPASEDSGAEDTS